MTQHRVCTSSKVLEETQSSQILHLSLKRLLHLGLLESPPPLIQILTLGRFDVPISTDSVRSRIEAYGLVPATVEHVLGMIRSAPEMLQGPPLVCLGTVLRMRGRNDWYAALDGINGGRLVLQRTEGAPYWHPASRFAAAFSAAK